MQYIKRIIDGVERYFAIESSEYEIKLEEYERQIEAATEILVRISSEYDDILEAISK